MLRLVENPRWDLCLNQGEYVYLNIEGDEVMLLKSREDDSVYFVMEDILTGCLPERVELDRIKDITRWHSLCGWRVDWATGRKPLSEIVEWFIEDCHCFDGRLSFDDIQLVGSDGLLTPVTVTRKEFVLDSYTKTMYTGLNSYHHSHGIEMNTPTKELKEGAYRIGVELEIEANSRTDRNEINKVRSNWFIQETDSSLRDGVGIELVTIPLLPKDAMSLDTWSPLVDFLKTRATSYHSSNCGLHIHIGREALGKDEEDRQATLGKLLFFYYEHLKDVEWNIKVFGRRHTYHETEFKCKESEAVKVLGMDLMHDKKIRDKVDKGLKDTANLTRYYDINVQNSATIEFRKGKGSICAERIVAIITYCDLMIRYCRKRDWMSMNAEDFLAYLRKTTQKSSPLFRYLPTLGEED